MVVNKTASSITSAGSASGDMGQTQDVGNADIATIAEDQEEDNMDDDIIDEDELEREMGDKSPDGEGDVSPE